MDTFLQMRVFFLISSVGFVILFILVAVFLFYLIRAMRTFSRISDKLEKGVDEVGDATKDMVKDIMESLVYKFFFRKKKKRHKD